MALGAQRGDVVDIRTTLVSECNHAGAGRAERVRELLCDGKETQHIIKKSALPKHTPFLVRIYENDAVKL